jgi:hypothetical protein
MTEGYEALRAQATGAGLAPTTARGLALTPRWVRPRLSAGGHNICGRATVQPCTWTTHLLVQAFCSESSSTFGLFFLTTGTAIRMPWPYHRTRPPTAAVLAVVVYLTARPPLPYGARDTLS